MDKVQFLRNISDSGRVMDEISLPGGEFLVTSSFIITPGGGWRMTFEKGSVLKYESGSKKLYSWDPVGGEWKLRTPPISGETKLDISQYARNPEQREMLAAFVKGTKKLSSAELKKALSSMTKEFTGTQKDAIKFLTGLSSSQKVKIVIVN